MKSKEEIEQLALQRFPIEMVAIFTERDKVDKNKERRKIFIETYTQCQEDMADKKYTEEDIRKAVRIFFPLSVDDIVKLDKYINSLNKGD